MVEYIERKENPCPRCGGRRTIPTPDGKHNEVCPICGGSGRGEKEPNVKWQ